MMPKRNREFYIVISENGPSTNPYIHETLTSAHTEAERLARQNKGTRFYVFTCNGYALVEEPVTYVDFQELPF